MTSLGRRSRTPSAFTVLGRPYDLWNHADRAAFEEAGGHRDKRPGVVANAALWGTQLILAEMERLAGSRCASVVEAQLRYNAHP